MRAQVGPSLEYFDAVGEGGIELGLNRARVLYSWGLTKGREGEERGGKGGGDGQYIVFELGGLYDLEKGRRGRGRGQEGGGNGEEKNQGKMC